MEDKNYFISYAAYYTHDGNYTTYDLFNDITSISGKVTKDVIGKLEEELLLLLAEETKHYLTVQIIAINKI